MLRFQKQKIGEEEGSLSQKVAMKLMVKVGGKKSRMILAMLLYSETHVNHHLI
jgi:hypothetical protein